MTPKFVTVNRRIRETADVMTFEIPSQDIVATSGVSNFEPGQFNMLYAFGVGEVPISISGDPAVTDRIAHTIRAVGPVSKALLDAKRGTSIGVRGPFGSSWPVAAAAGSDVLVIAGGIGLAPLRPAVYKLLGARERYGRIAVLYGARAPADLLFCRDLDRWRRLPDLQVRVTVDHATQDWIGDIGFVTKLLPKIRFDPVDTVAMICGPEVMIRFTASALEDMGVTHDRIYVSMERNMKCAVGWCGHCQFGAHFVCKDGPIFRLDRIKELFGLREI
ncbi:MAG: NAD(P)H-flavin reductase [Gammaproteobacteria bacterium]|jgi:NAD(P)H-flavin reductase